jgi:putative oxidoreductase
MMDAAGGIMTQRTEDAGKLVLRLSVGGLMFFHGLAKVRDHSFIEDAVMGVGLPAWTAYGVFIGEIVAPLLLIVGLFTRTAALFVMVDMIAALTLVHSGELTNLTPGGGLAIELPLLFLFGAMTIALVGPGRFAVAWNPVRDLVATPESISPPLRRAR